MLLGALETVIEAKQERAFRGGCDPEPLFDSSEKGLRPIERGAVAHEQTARPQSGGRGCGGSFLSFCTAKNKGVVSEI